MGLIEDILDLEVPYGPKLSPDGSAVVYQTTLKWHHKKGENNCAPLWIARTDIERSAHRLTDGTYNDRMPQWAPDGRSIVFLSDRANSGKACALYRLVIGDESSEPQAIMPADNETRFYNFSSSPCGKYIAFVSARLKYADKEEQDAAKSDVHVWGRDWKYDYLHLLDVVKGTIEVVSPEGVHVHDFAWNDDGTEVAIVTHRTPDIESSTLYGSEIYAINIETHDTRKVCHVQRDVLDLTWRGSELFFRTYNIPDQGTSGWALFSVEATITSEAYRKASNGDRDCAAGLVKAGRDIIVYVQNGMQDELCVLGGDVLIREKRWIKDFDAVYAQESKDLIILTSEGDVNHPTEVFVTRVGGEKTQLSDHGAGFVPEGLGTCTLIQCQTLDGKERLDAMYLTPARQTGADGKPKSPLQTVVLIHGGPYSRMLDAFDSFDPIHLFTPLILAEGYGILIPNYRGSSGRGERFASYTRCGFGMYDEPDIVAMTQHAIDEGYADKTRLVAGGWSQGGYLSYLSAVRNGAHGFGWRFQGIFAGAGVTEWDSMSLTSDIGYQQAEDAGGEIWNMDKSDIRTRQGSALWEFKDAVREHRIPPMLMLHGERDARVPVTQAWGFRRALDRAGLPFEFASYPREGHFFKERKHIVDLMERVVRFVKAHLG